MPVGNPGILTCEDAGGDFYWKSHDLSVSVFPNSFTGAPAKVNITAYLSNNNQSFCGCHIVSAVFKIESSIASFSPPVKLRIPHCVKLDNESDCAKMRFLVQHEGEYAIKKDGIFNVNEFYGTVELTKFSYVSIIWENAVNYCRMIISFITPSQESNSSHEQQHDQQQPDQQQPDQQLQQLDDSSSSESKTSSSDDHQSHASKPKDQSLTNLVYGEILTLPHRQYMQSERWIGAYCIVKNLKTWLQVI